MSWLITATEEELTVGGFEVARAAADAIEVLAIAVIGRGGDFHRFRLGRLVWW